jgi:hypothetical protein
MAYKIYKVYTEHYDSHPYYRTYNTDKQPVVNDFVVETDDPSTIEELARQRVGARRFKTLMTNEVKQS